MERKEMARKKLAKELHKMYMSFKEIRKIIHQRHHVHFSKRKGRIT
jgi:hypothetical protein